MPSSATTNFRLHIDGFAFSNEDWELTAAETSQIEALVKKELPKAVALATPILLAASPLILAILGPALILAGPFLPLILPAVIKKAIKKISSTIAGDATTWCGGIAFTAMDFYTQYWALPRGNGSIDRPPGTGQANATAASAALQAYLWSRLVDCQLACLPEAILLHFMRLIMKEYGKSYNRKVSLQAVDKVVQSLDAGTPCCIYLLDTGNNPAVDHVVVATGYTEENPGVWAINIYDVDLPDNDKQFLVVDATIPDSSWEINEPNRPMTWAGMFVAPYAPKTPPPAIVLSTELQLTPPSSDGVGRSVTATYQARNQGFHTTLPLKLCVFNGNVPASPIFIDGIPEPGPYSEGATIPVKWPPLENIFRQPGVLELFPGMALWPESDPNGEKAPSYKLVPYFDGKSANTTVYRITPPIDIKVWGVPLEGCAPAFVEGHTVALHADIEPVLAIGVAGYQWTVAGAVTLSSSAPAPEIANLPAAGSQVHVALVVSLNDGSAAYGATDLTVMSQSQASQISQLCWQIRQVEEKFGMGDSRVVGPEVDAGPWLAAVEALDGRDAKQALADLTKALTAGISLIGGVD
jgi:hypothetical protein